MDSFLRKKEKCFTAHWSHNTAQSFSADTSWESSSENGI